MADYYRIKKETAVGLADEARRLGNVEGELTTAQMKEIFAGVTIGGGSGNTNMEDELIAGTVSVYTNDSVTDIRNYAFYRYSNLTAVSFPNATTVGSYAFQYCSKLTEANFPNVTTVSSCAFLSCYSLLTANFPNATTVGNSAFQYCSNLTEVNLPVVTSICGDVFNNCPKLIEANFPNVTTVGSFAFRGCASLTYASLPNAIEINPNAFANCFHLMSLYLTGASLCKLYNSNAFSYNPIGGYLSFTSAYGSIYVPASLLTSYQTATNWTYFSSRFVGI